MKKRKTLFFTYIMIAHIFIISGPGHGYKEADLNEFRIGKYCEKCDLSGADFAGLNLCDAMLSGANLSNANLSKTDLSDSDLTDANLTNADTSGAILTNTELTGATWVDGKKCKKGSIGICIR